MEQQIWKKMEKTQDQNMLEDDRSVFAKKDEKEIWDKVENIQKKIKEEQTEN